MLRKIIKGCGYIEGYGTHPGTPMITFFVALGVVSGAQGGGWVGACLGAACMSPFVGLYLYGAWGRVNDAEKGRV